MRERVVVGAGRSVGQAVCCCRRRRRRSPELAPRCALLTPVTVAVRVRATTARAFVLVRFASRSPNPTSSPPQRPHHQDHHHHHQRVSGITRAILPCAHLLATPCRQPSVALQSSLSCVIRCCCRNIPVAPAILNAGGEHGQPHIAMGQAISS